MPRISERISITRWTIINKNIGAHRAEVRLAILLSRRTETVGGGTAQLPAAECIAFGIALHAESRYRLIVTASWLPICLINSVTNGRRGILDFRGSNVPAAPFVSDAINGIEADPRRDGRFHGCQSDDGNSATELNRQKSRANLPAPPPLFHLLSHTSELD